MRADTAPGSLTHLREATRQFSAWSAALLGTLTLLMMAFSGQAWAEEATGPTHLMINYRSSPTNRPAFRQYLTGPGVARFEELRREGVIANFQILFNWYNDVDTWDAMAVVRFRRYADIARWKEVENTSPGGLDKEGLALASPTLTYSADLAWQGGTPASGADAGKRVFYVIPYQYKDLAQYKKYVDGYVIPQVQGWIREGILAQYRLYLNRYPVGERWDALFMYEYKDLDSFGRREPVLAKVRGTLRDDPTWSALHAIKGDIRSEDENAIADALIAR